jgi:hypothetical protein
VQRVRATRVSATSSAGASVSHATGATSSGGRELPVCGEAAPLNPLNPLNPLQASEEAWAEQKTRVSAELAAAKKPLSMFGKMIGDLANQVVTGSSRVERAEDAEVLKVQEYYTTAAVHMADVRRQGERLVKRQGGARPSRNPARGRREPFSLSTTVTCTSRHDRACVS